MHTTNPELEAIILAVAEPSSPFWIISVYKIQTCVVRSLRGSTFGKQAFTKRYVCVCTKGKIRARVTCVD